MTATDENVGRFSRRKVLGAGLAAGAATAVNVVGRGSVAGALVGGSAPVHAAVGESTGLTFTPIGPSALVDLWRFAPGYVGNVLIAWGDPIFANEPWKHPLDLTAADQERRFGFNCD